jgi:hypothetical protein
MPQEIIAFKLSNGMEIVGRKVSVDDTSVVLEKARVVQMVQTGPNAVGMSLQPFMVSDIDGEVPFVRAHFVTGIINPSEEVEKPYLEQTTSIALA